MHRATKVTRHMFELSPILASTHQMLLALNVQTRAVSAEENLVPQLSFILIQCMGKKKCESCHTRKHTSSNSKIHVPDRSPCTIHNVIQDAHSNDYNVILCWSTVLELTVNLNVTVCAPRVNKNKYNRTHTNLLLVYSVFQELEHAVVDVLENLHKW